MNTTLDRVRKKRERLITYLYMLTCIKKDSQKYLKLRLLQKKNGRLKEMLDAKFLFYHFFQFKEYFAASSTSFEYLQKIRLAGCGDALLEDIERQIEEAHSLAVQSSVSLGHVTDALWQDVPKLPA